MLDIFRFLFLTGGFSRFPSTACTTLGSGTASPGAAPRKIDVGCRVVLLLGRSPRTTGQRSRKLHPAKVRTENRRKFLCCHGALGASWYCLSVQGWTVSLPMWSRTVFHSRFPRSLQGQSVSALPISRLLAAARIQTNPTGCNRLLASQHVAVQFRSRFAFQLKVGHSMRRAADAASLRNLDLS